jgi:hypothetical protein
MSSDVDSKFGLRRRRPLGQKRRRSYDGPISSVYTPTLELSMLLTLFAPSALLVAQLTPLMKLMPLIPTVLAPLAPLARWRCR